LSQTVFQHATAGKQVRFYAQLTGPSTNLSSPGCSVRMQGFLLDAN
jgi:hypothetical protein